MCGCPDHSCIGKRQHIKLWHLMHLLNMVGLPGLSPTTLISVDGAMCSLRSRCFHISSRKPIGLQLLLNVAQIVDESRSSFRTGVLRSQTSDDGPSYTTTPQGYRSIKNEVFGVSKHLCFATLTPSATRFLSLVARNHGRYSSIKD